MQNIKITLISLLIVMMGHSLLLFPIEILPSAARGLSLMLQSFSDGAPTARLFIWLLKEYLKT